MTRKSTRQVHEGMKGSEGFGVIAGGLLADAPAVADPMLARAGVGLSARFRRQSLAVGDIDGAVRLRNETVERFSAADANARREAAIAEVRAEYPDVDYEMAADMIDEPEAA